MRLVFIRLSTSLRRRLGAPIPSNPMRWSSSRRSRTPRMKAPCALPPCSARLISPAPLCGRRPVGAPRRLDRLTRSTSCLLPIGAPARLAGAPVVRRECTEPYWRPEMPREYDADARRLSRLRRHGNLSRARTSAPRSEVLFANVGGRLLSEPTEILLEPSVGSRASHLHQVGQVVPVCIELVAGTPLGHDVGG